MLQEFSYENGEGSQKPGLPKPILGYTNHNEIWYRVIRLIVQVCLPNFEVLQVLFQ